MTRAAPQVDAFGGGGFRLSGDWRPGSVLILDDVAHPWPIASAAALSVEPFASVLKAGPAVSELLVREVRQAFLAAGLGLEFLDTPAAARLYNLLTSEGRRVAAALIAV
jgi:uncharacterized protein